MSRLFDAVDKSRQAIFNAEEFLWKHPAPGYKEWAASDYLAEKFEELGYDLTRAGDIPGFMTRIDTGRPGPCIMILSELDSLIVPGHPDADPETGAVHACGHHSQGAAMLGIAMALNEPGALDEMSGTIRLCVVPAEELIETGYRETLRKKGVIRFFGGKIEFMHRGFFDGVDIAYMVHSTALPGKLKLALEEGSNGCVVKNISFIGKSAHAGGSPEDGINALYAANLGMAAINSLRETFLDDKHVRVHPIITHGGDAVNAIPAKVDIESYVRASDLETIADVNDRVNRALAGSAAAMGANVIISDRAGYSPLINDTNLIDLAHPAMLDVVSEDEICIDHSWSTGSTDMGDVSAVMPAIHAYVGGAVGTNHGNDFRIKDKETACVRSAKFQLALLERLLKNGAAEAKSIIARKQTRFSSIEEFLETISGMERDSEAVTYGATDDVHLKW